MNITHAGMIALVGRPNVGKSTWLNRLAGEKVAIVSNKPQTTRHRICAVYNREPKQYVFMDTPGFHKPRNRLGDYMVSVVRECTVGVDAAVLLVEPVPRIGTPERLLIERLKDGGVPVILGINKCDTVTPKEKLLAVIDIYRAEMEFVSILPLSGRTGEGAALLLDTLEPFIPEGPGLFPEDMVSDQTTSQLIAEIVREKILKHLDEEVPHGVAVVVERIQKRENGVDIDVAIVCEKDSHKGIVIGKKGAMLGKIGTEARLDIAEFFDGPVHLHTWVQVRENWREKPDRLRSFGYEL